MTPKTPKTPKTTADFIDYVPSKLLADPVRKGNPSSKNYKKLSTKTRSKPLRIEEGITLYGGHDGFLVRTVLLRSNAYAEQSKRPTVIQSSYDVFRVCRHLGLHDQEHIVILALSKLSEIMAIYEAAIGKTGGAEVELRHAIKVPVLVGAPAVIVVHNHPSGSIDPSKQDSVMRRQLQASLKCIGVQLVDNVIITHDGYFSYLDEDLMTE